MTMRRGIFGGTFDPVHYGHLLLAETCREALQLDHIHWIPAGDPPHKPGQRIVDGHARADMLTLALAGCPEFSVDRRELRREGPSYTVETLSEFREEFTDAELFFLMGADSLRDLPAWRDPERMTQLATVVAVNRPGLPSLTADQVRAWIGDELADRVHPLTMPGTDISATSLRDRIRDSRSVRFLVPKAVEMYIREHSFYVAD